MIQLPTDLFTKKERLNNIACGSLAIIGAAIVLVGLVTGNTPLSTVGGILAALSLVLSK